MPPRPNPLLTAGEFLVAETERSESFNALEHLFDGSLEVVKQRWAATAVLDNAGAWHIVRSSEHVQGEAGSRRVKLYSGGSFGRGYFRPASWFQTNAAQLYLGSLEVPDGRGAAALHSVDGQDGVVSVTAPTEASADGSWAVRLLIGSSDEVRTMQEALDAVGARSITVAALLAPEEPDGDGVVALSSDSQVSVELADAFSQLGVDEADSFRGTVPSLDLVGALCAAVGKPGVAVAADALLRRHEAGLSVRRGIQLRLTASFRAAGDDWEALIALSVSVLSATNASVRGTWPRGVGVALALDGALRRRRQLQAAAALSAPPEQPAAPAAAPAASPANAALQIIPQAGAPRPTGRVRTGGGGDDDDDSDGSSSPPSDSEDSSPVPALGASTHAAGASLAVLAPVGAEHDTPQTLLASLAAGRYTAELDASDTGPTAQAAISRLAAVYRLKRN